jgi:hypothetical protein
MFSSGTFSRGKAMRRRALLGFLAAGPAAQALAQGTTDGLRLGDRDHNPGTLPEPTHYVIHGRPDGAALYRGHLDGDSVVVTATFTRRGWARLVESQRLKTADHTVVSLDKLLQLIAGN